MAVDERTQMLGGLVFGGSEGQEEQMDRIETR
jgi:hypothetical protein